MSQIVYTMPEAKFRSTKKRVQPVRSNMSTTTTVSVAFADAAHASAEAMPMPKAAKAAKAEKKKAKDAPSIFSIASWWPVAVGIFLSGFAPEWHAMFAQAGIWALRATFPLTILATHREIGFDDQFAAMAPQIALYIQLPLEGLLAMFTLARGRSLQDVVIQLLGIHAVCVLVLWLLTMAPQ